MRQKNVVVLLFIIAIMWVLHTVSKNFMVDPTFESFLSRKDVILTNENLWTTMIQVHIILAVVALMTGPLGLVKKLRVPSASFHRWNGRIYVLSIVLNFIPGIYVAFFATGGWLSTFGFIVLELLWLTTTLLGYIHIRKRNIDKHRRWIIRSFSLSYANMTIYILVTTVHFGFTLSYAVSYTVAVWLCWIINLLLAEWIIKKK